MGTRTILAGAGKASVRQLNQEEQKKLRAVLLEMCEDITHFCEKNGLVCTLGGGSVLGAVRHNGFIPWDDDLDMNMPRRDYQKFIRDFPAAYPGKYELFVPDGSHRITNLFMKVSRCGTLSEDIYTAGCPVRTGISVDVFPLENVPAGKLKRKLKGAFTEFLSYAVISAFMFQNRSDKLKAAYGGSGAGAANYRGRMVLGFLLSWKRYEKWYCFFDRFVQDREGSGLSTFPTGRKRYLGEIQKNEVFFPPVKHSFETIEAYIPHDSDAYLTGLYGNYMEIPPKEKQEQHFYLDIRFPEEAKE